ncbi:hypothetical protein SAMN05444156_1188 [Verrucomicrobium sp. GAS474]|uniref:hypothetical protein n=1 Tax=Verrucomicrobium sp. GAS474 TaxID=1882831 RepID=UPI00087C1A8B|nr:hypothetical protein [Verrucomicrobium sp. GAS474]SDT97504.1 hypothetical protein SAMN05444156_1188 [Verrucomicrobium sp. GAS474]
MMPQQTIHQLLHGEAALPEDADAGDSLRDPSREELFLALQKGSEESRTARKRAVEQATSIVPI